jgi:hypothetical protein
VPCGTNNMASPYFADEESLRAERSLPYESICNIRDSP